MVVEFREVVGCKGYPYTWSNKRFDANYIEKWLDRFLCSKDWGNKF